MSTEITIPYNFKARDYQIPLLRAMDNWIKRAVIIWHRRTGKDKTCFNLCIKKALERVWTYFYIFPTYAQWKKAIWDWIDKDWFKILSHIPDVILKNKNQTEMKIELKNWSIIQVVWTDWNNIDRLVWTNPIWCIFSEYSIQNPKAWDLLRPILMENWWWAIFNYTPRWKNHWYDLYEMARYNDNWYCQLLTANDTKRADWTSVITQEMIEEERNSWMSEDMILQEYYCSFEASIQWAYYSAQMKKAEEDKRIWIVPYEPKLQVHTFWDLWVDDSTTIRFAQIINREVRLIDYYENSWEWLTHYLDYIKSKSYTYWFHYFPHDIQVREFTTGKSREETLREKGIKNYKIVPKLWVQDWIDAVRQVLSNCYFDLEKCKHWIRCLKDYHKEYDEDRKIYKSYPEHDRSSHWADSFRYLAVSVLNVLKHMDSQRQDDVVQVDYSGMV